MFASGTKVKFNSAGLEWSKHPGKHKHVYIVRSLTGINAREPNDRLTPVYRTLRGGREVFCGLIATDYLVSVDSVS